MKTATYFFFILPLGQFGHLTCALCIAVFVGYVTSYSVGSGGPVVGVMDDQGMEEAYKNLSEPIRTY